MTAYAPNTHYNVDDTIFYPFGDPYPVTYGNTWRASTAGTTSGSFLTIKFAYPKTVGDVPPPSDPATWMLDGGVLWVWVAPPRVRAYVPGAKYYYGDTIHSGRTCDPINNSWTWRVATMWSGYASDDFNDNQFCEPVLSPLVDGEITWEFVPVVDRPTAGPKFASHL